MAKLKYRVRVLLGDQELVLLVPAAPETTIGELQADVLARAQRQGVIGSACAFSVDGALLDELDSVEDVLEAEQTIDARLTPLRECSWSATDLAALVREGFSPALRHTIVETHASLAAFRRSPDGSRLLPSRVTPAKRPAPEDCVAAPAPADEDESDAGEPADEDSVAAPAPAPADADESDDEEYVWPAEAPRGASAGQTYSSSSLSSASAGAGAGAATESSSAGSPASLSSSSAGAGAATQSSGAGRFAGVTRDGSRRLPSGDRRNAARLAWVSTIVWRSAGLKPSRTNAAKSVADQLHSRSGVSLASMVCSASRTSSTESNSSSNAPSTENAQADPMTPCLCARASTSACSSPMVVSGAAGTSRTSSWSPSRTRTLYFSLAICLWLCWWLCSPTGAGATVVRSRATPSVGGLPASCVRAPKSRQCQRDGPAKLVASVSGFRIARFAGNQGSYRLADGSDHKSCLGPDPN